MMDRAGRRASRRYIEFSSQPGEVEALAAGFGTGAWRVRIGGLVAREHDLTLHDLLRTMPVESCPCAASRDDSRPNPHWTGFPLAALVRWARGAPLRLVLPWKQGAKSVKAITRFEFTARPPRTFRGDMRSRDYDFSA